MAINNMEQQLTKQDVINIIREQSQLNLSAGIPAVPPHTHDKVNNIQIKEKDLILNLGTGGTVLFARNATYTFELLNAPRVIIFNGRAGNSGTTYNLTTGLAAGAFIGYLTSVYTGSSQSFSVIFSSGEVRNVNFTNSSLEVFWTQALTLPASSVLTIDTSTVMAVINGSAYLKNSWSLQPVNKSTVIEGTTPPYLPYPLNGTPYYLQGCSWMTIDTTNLANTKTGASGQYLVYATDHTGATLVSLQLTPPLNGSNNIQLTVTVSSGWSIYGEFIIY
jgi:hypothetical protein